MREVYSISNKKRSFFTIQWDCEPSSAEVSLAVFPLRYFFDSQFFFFFCPSFRILPILPDCTKVVAWSLATVYWSDWGWVADGAWGDAFLCVLPFRLQKFLLTIHPSAILVLRYANHISILIRHDQALVWIHCCVMLSITTRYCNVQGQQRKHVD